MYAVTATPNYVLKTGFYNNQMTKAPKSLWRKRKRLSINGIYCNLPKNFLIKPFTFVFLILSLMHK